MSTKEEINSRYKVHSTVLGKGKQGEVYLGRDTKKKRKVAVKIIPNVGKGLREAAVMENYGKNKFLPRIYYQTVHKKKVYIIMEYIDGITLKEFKRNNRIKEKKAVKLARNILRGLQQLHDKGYYHNDLHPDNVMIKKYRSSTLRIIDFSGSTDKKNKYNNDLYRVSCLLLYLLRKDGCGYSRYPELRLSLDNKKLKKILMKGLKKKYNTAQEYIGVLRSYLKED